MFNATPNYSTIVYVQNGRTLETDRIGGAASIIERDAQHLIEKFYGGGKVTLVKHF